MHTESDESEFYDVSEVLSTGTYTTQWMSVMNSAHIRNLHVDGRRCCKSSYYS